MHTAWLHINCKSRTLISAGRGSRKVVITGGGGEVGGHFPFL